MVSSLAGALAVVVTLLLSQVMNEHVEWFDNFELAPALERPNLLAAPVRAALTNFSDSPSLSGSAILVAPIDADLADTAAFCEHYGAPLAASANCVITLGKRAGEQRFAAVMALATTRADINNVVRRHVDVRKISFAPMDEATRLTGMEYGGITPIGLPEGWPILIDSAVTHAGPVVIGSGIRGSKIIVEGAALAELPGAVVLDGLAKPA